MCEFDQHGRRIQGPAGFVDDLVTAMVNARIYTAEHPRVQSLLAELVQRLTEHFRSDATDFALELAEGYLLFEKRTLLGATMSAPRLIQALQACGAAGLKFERGVTLSDIGALLRVLGTRQSRSDGVDAVNRELLATGGTRVSLLLPRATSQLGTAGTGEGAIGSAAASQPLSVPLQIYQNIVGSLQEIAIDVSRGAELNFDTAQAQIEKVMRQLDNGPDEILRLSRYEHYDAFTFGHSIRVSFLAMNFARALTQDAAALHRIGMAALLHDVGKARVPFEVLHSRTRLTPEQRREMELHTTHGGSLLLEMGHGDPWMVTTAFGHHRTSAGTGYPRTPIATKLSTVTELVKICDVYEALTAVRPYKDSMTPSRAYRVMLSMHNHFDRELLRLFIETNGIFPTGTEVLLSNGEVARVSSQTDQLLRPIVVVEQTPDGDRLQTGDQRQLDLRQQGAAGAITVQHSLSRTPLQAAPA